MQSDCEPPGPWTSMGWKSCAVAWSSSPGLDRTGAGMLRFRMRSQCVIIVIIGTLHINNSIGTLYCNNNNSNSNHRNPISPCLLDSTLWHSPTPQQLCSGSITPRYYIRRYLSFHFLFHYPDIAPIYTQREYSSFHFLFHYPNITPIYKEDPERLKPKPEDQSAGGSRTHLLLMEQKMETTIVCRGYRGIMETKWKLLL